MDYRITEDDRVRFKRCRRQWDFASSHRRGLEPVSAVDPVLPAALKDALAVYYYPGTWDWQPEPDAWMTFSAPWPWDPQRLRAFFDDLLAELESMVARADRCRWPLDEPWPHMH